MQSSKVIDIGGKSGQKARLKIERAFRRENNRRLKELAELAAAFRERIRATA